MDSGIVPRGFIRSELRDLKTIAEVALRAHREVRPHPTPRRGDGFRGTAVGGDSDCREKEFVRCSYYMIRRNIVDFLELAKNKCVGLRGNDTDGRERSFYFGFPITLT